MKVDVLVRTTEYMGDHSREVLIPYEIREGETVESLVERLLPSDVVGGDWIELRRLRLERNP